MFSSSMFGVESLSLSGSLFQMARTAEKKSVDLNIEAEKEKNKYSFLQVPKLNTINTSESVNYNLKPMGASMMFKQTPIKTPSFLKRDAKSNTDSNEEHTEGILKRP